MYSLMFSGTELQRLTTQYERHSLGLSREELISQIESYYLHDILEGIYQFHIDYVGSLYINRREKETIDYLCQNLVIRKLHQNIKRVYNASQADRNQIIRQVKIILEDPYPLWIIRLDIKPSYEGIDRDVVLNKFKSDSRVNYQTIELLENLFSYPLVYSIKGLPKGLSISSAIPELFMKYFDLDVQGINGAYCYTRFVDDIIIFCNYEKTRDEVYNTIPVLLEKMRSTLNQDKSYTLDETKLTSNRKFSYLGYSFSLKKIGKNRKQKNELLISITENKAEVIKTKSTKAFVRFIHDKNYDMLINRMKYLTGNSTAGNIADLTPIRSGVYFSYKMISGSEKERQLQELNLYYNKMLHCKKDSFGYKLSSLLSKGQKKRLSKYSFYFGFENHVSHYFHSKLLCEIKKCWL